MKLLISNNGKTFLVRDETKEFHSQYGYVGPKDLQAEPGSIIETNTGHKLSVIDPGIIDLRMKMKRGAQIIPSKDVGFIISETGLCKKSTVIDAGAGSGGLCLTLAFLAKKVYTFDVRDDHLEIVRKNKDFLGLTNLSVKKGDVYADKLPKDIDLVTLDVPEPWEALDNIFNALKPGGFLVTYSPSIPQVSDTVEALHGHSGLVYQKTVEILEREWEFSGRKIRPKTQQRIGHSGFLTFARKMRK